YRGHMIYILQHYRVDLTLDALVAREDGKDKAILPIWHNIGKEDIMRYSPLLSDKLAVSSIKGINFIVEEITKACSDLY
ncbi:MAG: hypothetical protein K8R08_06955, partial [Methanosarcinales archaeon]|nr:hypothetical protein [Methanosarcinales archaeon]